MLVSTIVAVAADNVIGKGNQIPWYLPADLKYFKAMTTGHHVIMGRKCFESIGRPLPNRTNVVITRDLFFAATGCVVVHSLEEALNFAFENEEAEAFVIGGGEIYKQSMTYWDKIYITEVDLKVDGDIYFPSINEAEWIETKAEKHVPDEKNEYNYCFKVLERRP